MGYAENNKRLNPLTTDFYQLTMAQSFFDEGIAERESSYYLHWRTPAFKDGTYNTVAGVEEAADFLKNFKFTDKHIAYLASQERKGKKLFTPDFLEFLKKTPMKLDVEVLPEGEVQTTPGPVMRVKGPLYQCQLVESALLCIMNHNSIVATKASRLHEAVEGEPLAAFGLRRQPGLGLDTPRAAYIGGCNAVADTDASMQLGIPVTGTMAHAYIMNFQKKGEPNVETELKAFKAFLKSMPTNSVLLADTYNPYQGIDNAIKAAIETNTELDGVRLDSGNLVDLTWYAFKQLREAAKTHPNLFSQTRVFLTDGLDELKVVKLRKDLNEISMKEEGTPFPKGKLAFGVGTELHNPGPFRGGVYKVCAHGEEIEINGLESTLNQEIACARMEPVMKLAGVNPEDPTLPSSKASIPGEDLDIARLWKKGKIVSDIVVDKALGLDALIKGGKGISLHDNKTPIAFPAYDKVETLLKPMFRRDAKGLSQYMFEEPAKKTLSYSGEEVTDLAKIRQFHLDRKAALPDAVRRIENPEKPLVLIDPAIQARRLAIIAKTNAELSMRPGVTTTGDLRPLGGPDKDQQIT